MPDGFFTFSVGFGPRCEPFLSWAEALATSLLVSRLVSNRIQALELRLLDLDGRIGKATRRGETIIEQLVFVRVGVRSHASIGKQNVGRAAMDRRKAAV